MGITPDNTIFIVLSFEGPDVYSMAGGLGARVTHLTETLARLSFEVHHIFVGDPGMDGVEVREDGKLVLHRWCQWISKYHPGGAYDGEEGKLYDFTRSAPPFVVHELARPAISQGKLVVILGDEWHTAETMYRISDLLYRFSLREKTVMFWNANNTYGFDRIDWRRLSQSTTVTTVSKYMKQIMLGIGINPLVIPNGIPKSLLKEVDRRYISRTKEVLGADLILSKVARWHPDKGWKPAIDSIGSLRKSGGRPVLIARGGTESYGKEISKRAKSLGLIVRNIFLERDSVECYHRAAVEADFDPYFEAISKAGSGDVLNLTFPIPPSFLEVIYGASDAVLANSTFEPFGLVGLEAMATGSIVFTGCSGEDYATHMHNAIVLDTFSSKEIAYYIDYLRAHPNTKEAISTAARQTAAQWTWEEVIKILVSKLEYTARV
jgi:glycosyltransferase involved in cell wall biosynthesis